MAAFGLGGFGDLRGGGQGLGALGAALSAGRSFEEQYHCYPVSFQDREHLEGGDKILLPSSALDALARQQVEYPMLFEISNPAEGKRTHCGVLEFSAPEGSCYIPYWMMSNLLLGEGSLLTVKNVSLPKGTFVKFQPQSVDFLDISNPRAVLETTMRRFSCLTEGDVICIPYINRKYYLEVKELKPVNAVGIVETDLNVDFDAPVGYNAAEAAAAARRGSGDDSEGGKGAAGSGDGGESRGARGPALNIPAPVSGKVAKPDEEQSTFVPFSGEGARLDGKVSAAKDASGEGRKGQGANSESRKTAAATAAEARAAAAAGGSGSRATSASEAPTRYAMGVKPPAGKWSKSKKLQTGAFQGTGNRLN